MKFILALSALVAAASAAGGPCKKGTYTYEGCVFDVACHNAGAGYKNFVYKNVTTFDSCMQQCLTGEYGCDAVNYSARKNTCTLLVSPTGTSAAPGMNYAAKTTSTACKNEG